MATLIEVGNFINVSRLRNKIGTAIAINMEVVLSGDDGIPPFSQGVGAHDTRMIWANGILGKVSTDIQKFSELVLAKNSGISEAQIQAAIDAEVESDVDPIADRVRECVDLVAGVI